MNNKDFGNSGEEIASKYLVEKGFRIIKRNYRYGKGEIDIIAEIGDTLVFVEVKTRANEKYGPAELAVSLNKQKQIKKIAQLFLIENNILDKECRIDVIAINFIRLDKYNLNHIENAF